MSHLVVDNFFKGMRLVRAGNMIAVGCKIANINDHGLIKRIADEFEVEDHHLKVVTSFKETEKPFQECMNGLFEEHGSVFNFKLVEHLDGRLSNQTFFINIAKNDSDWECRLAAIWRISVAESNQAVLIDIAKNDPNEYCRFAAIWRISDAPENQVALVHIAHNDPDKDCQLAAMNRLRDDEGN